MTNYFKSTAEITIGDLIIRSPSGRKPIEVTKIDGNYIHGKYVESGKPVWEYYNSFQPYENNDQTIMSKEQLFTWPDNHGQQYGTYLATNSSGQYVLEVKQTGQIVTMHPDYLEEVIPWTFSAKNASIEKHFTGPRDTIKKGDALLQYKTSKFWIVTDVDTKNKTATKFVGRRFVTEEI
jgi:hypothetical protein